MKITFVLPSFDLSGGVKVVAIYAQRLKRRGHSVFVVAPAPSSPPLSQKVAMTLRDGRWPSAKKHQDSHIYHGDIDFQLLNREGPISESDVPDADLIVATWWETAEWINRLSAKKGKKVHFIQHHEVFPYLPIERCKAVYRLPLHKIVISRWLKEIMEEEYGDPSTILIPNSVDLNQFFAASRGKQQTPTVGFLYSTVSFKAVDVTLDALQRARQQLGAINAIAFGSEKVSSQIPLPEWIEFHHSPPQDQIREIYSRCDVWACGSISEGFGLPTLEAMACRCPVVSTRIGGPMDFVNEGRNGFLVDVGDSVALTDKLLEVLRLDETSWQQMSRNAFETATQYSWDDATELLEKAFTKALNGNFRQ
jgi:glycosyltransferase involved in cell wall biosynthesis